MTYCLGIRVKEGLVMASDSRTNAGYDQVNVHRKMHTFVHPGERVFIILTSGSLSVSQSIIALLRKDWEAQEGLWRVETMYDAARTIGNRVRDVARLDREALERDDYHFNVHLLLGGQIKDHPTDLYLIYPQGNPLATDVDTPYLQIGESKYGRPILDRGIRFGATTLSEASKYALISLDSTMRSNLTVGPPIDLLVYRDGDLDIFRQRRFSESDPDLHHIRSRWESALRSAVIELPDIPFWSDLP